MCISICENNGCVRLSHNRQHETTDYTQRVNEVYVPMKLIFQYDL